MLTNTINVMMMKKLIPGIFITVLGIITLESFVPLKSKRRDGTDPGYTGSPGDGYKNCSNCHGGMAVTKEGWITSDIPEEGYVPGETYTITATNSAMGSTRFGFCVSPQALNGDLLGALLITDTLRTKLVGDNKYVTYRADGVEGVDSNVWVFDWVAPKAGTGNVVFYGAFNSNPGHKGSDGTTLSTLTVKEKGSTGLVSISDKVSNLLIYPNPVSDFVKVSFDLNGSRNVNIDISDVNGKSIVVIAKGKQRGTISKEVNTKGWAEGIYLLRIEVDRQLFTRKINVTH